MNGTLYGVGIGPGDPELITLKAVRIIEQSPVIAVPKTGESRRVALSIAEQTIPHIHEKEVLSLHFPMTKDKCMIDTNRDEIAKQIIDILKEGKDIAFLTLGDPSVYSTYWYIHQRVVKQGYQAQMIAGVPSFCAVAAKLGISLAEAEQPLHISPGSYPCTEQMLQTEGTKVIMKTGRSVEQVKKLLKQHGYYENAKMVQNCGLEQEHVFQSLDEATNDASYFSIIVCKEEDNQ